MTKKEKFNGIVKGAVVGVSLMLCMAVLPVNALANIAGAAEEAIVNAQKTIKINTKVEGNAEIGKVTKGDRYYVPTATFGTTNLTDEHIKVRHENSLLTTSLQKDEAKGAYYFDATREGKYIVSYTYTDGGKSYTYDYTVECKVSDVHFEFATNVEDIIPSIYDIALLNKSDDTKNKDIVLPIPSIIDEEDEAVEDLTVSTSRAADSKGNQLVITLSTGTKNVQIQKDETTGKYFIDGDLLAAKNDDGIYTALGVYRINYTYYSNGVFVAQTTKTFEVKDKYFMTEKDNTKSGYTLSASFASSEPTSAVTGVEKQLPSIKAVATESTQNNDIEVYYQINVYHYEDGKYVDRTSECLDSEDQTKFTPFKDGNYKIEYTVKDFYNNTAKVENVRIFINDVKDTQAPKVFAYVANEEKDAEGKYQEISYRIKSRQINRNLIMYAIGAEDNVENKNMELVRQIRDAANTTRVEVSDYNDKNLIFLPKAAKDSSILATIINDNYYLRQDMEKDKVYANSDASEIQAWLKENGYLIVTNDYNKNPITNANFEAGFYGDIVTDNTSSSFNLEKIKEKLASEGIAYVAYDKDYNFTQQQYSLYYKAKDDAGQETKDVYYTVNFSTDDAFNDSSAPALTFSTSLQPTYLKDDKIEFDAPVESDTQDTRLNVVFGYRYLSAKNVNNPTPITTDDTKTIEFNNNSKVSDKWYGQAGNITSSGWIMFNEKNTNNKYEIDFAKDLKKDGFDKAVAVELFAYAEDDYGNLGFFNRVIDIAQQTEDSELKLFDVKGIDQTTFDANTTITLPTVYYEDKYVEYMTGDVSVYYISTTGEGDEKTTTRTKVQSFGKDMVPDENRGLFIIKGGEFTASRAGDYQVVITAKDAGGNEQAVFFDYKVTTKGVIEDPVIDNISTSTVNLKIGQRYNFPAPTIAISDSDDNGYYGINQQDDVNLATYYSVRKLSGPNGKDDFQKTHFIPQVSGEYTFQYNVWLIRYAKENFSETGPQEGKLSLDGNRLIFTKGSTNYYVYVDMFDETNVDANCEKAPKLVVSTSLTRPETAATLSKTDYEGIFELFERKTEPQIFKVSEISSPVITIDDDLFNIENIVEEGTTKKIAIPELSATVDGGSIDLSKSKIEISVARGSGTTVLQTIMCDKMQEVDTTDVKYENNQLYLYLKYDGTYSIKYTAQGMNANNEAAADPTSKTFTIENGDVEKPEIEVKESEFLNRDKDKYSLRDNNLILNVDAITFKDNVSDVDYLKKHYSITVRNASTGNEVKREGEGAVYNYTLETAGEYEITIAVTDAAGWTTEKTISIKVATDAEDARNVYQIVGTVLIVVSVVVLAGVVTYFIVSKVKEDKKKKR